MTLQHAVIIAIAALATFATRALPFAVFRSDSKTPRVLTYLGKALPPAVFGMLVVYCLKGVTVLTSPYGIPELLGIIGVITLHLAFRRMLVSIIGGTAVYLILVNFIFI